MSLSLARLNSLRKVESVLASLPEPLHATSSDFRLGRSGSFGGCSPSKCLGGTADAPRSGACQNEWCGDGVLRLDPDPIETVAGVAVKVRIYLDGRFETGGNATTNGGADIDWGDGNHE